MHITLSVVTTGGDTCTSSCVSHTSSLASPYGTQIHWVYKLCMQMQSFEFINGMNHVKVFLPHDSPLQDVNKDKQVRWLVLTNCELYKTALQFNNRKILPMLNIFITGLRAGGCVLLPWQQTHLYSIPSPLPTSTPTCYQCYGVMPLTSHRRELRSHTCSDKSRRISWLKVKSVYFRVSDTTESRITARRAGRCSDALLSW